MKRFFFKINFVKAYDSVDWGFLDHMLKRFNFCRKWRRWILECVSSAYASVLFNGSPSGNSNWKEDNKVYVAQNGRFNF